MVVLHNSGGASFNVSVIVTRWTPHSFCDKRYASAEKLRLLPPLFTFFRVAVNVLPQDQSGSLRSSDLGEVDSVISAF